LLAAAAGAGPRHAVTQQYAKLPEVVGRQRIGQDEHCSGRLPPWRLVGAPDDRREPRADVARVEDRSRVGLAIARHHSNASIAVNFNARRHAASGAAPDLPRRASHDRNERHRRRCAGQRQRESQHGRRRATGGNRQGGDPRRPRFEMQAGRTLHRRPLQRRGTVASIGAMA
jgi:hypothetical protein